LSGHLKPDVPQQYGTLKAWITALAKQGMEPRQIIQTTGCSRSYAWTLYNKAQAAKPSKDAEELHVEVEEVTVETEQPPIITETEEEIPTVAISERIKAGMLEGEDIEYIFQAVNEMLPTKYKRPEKAIKVLGKVWEAPLNRLLAKYLDENIDLWVALIVTIVVFAPVPVQYVRDRKEKEALEAKKKTKDKLPKKAEGE